jgi:hypothetical protein
MHKLLQLALFGAVALLVCVCEAKVKGVENLESRGMLMLDGVTFSKVVPSKDVAVLVQVTNKQQIYEYTTEAIRSDYFAFAQKCNYYGDASSLLFSQVIVNGAQNRKLATSLGIPDKFDRPRLFLYPANSSTYIEYPMSGSYSDVALYQFVRKHADLHLPIPGIVEKMSPLVRPFLAADASEHQTLIDNASSIAAAADEKEKESSDYYVHVMKKVMENGKDYIKTEMKRIKGLMDSGSESKASSFVKKINVLGLFDLLRFSD